MGDFEYDLKKSGGPSVQKNHVRNRLMDRQMKNKHIFCALVKLYHTDPKVEYISKEKQLEIENRILADDLVPCLMYSMNKKARWEFVSNIGEEALQHLEDANGGLPTIVLERHLTDIYPNRYMECNRAYQNLINFSQCKTSHKLENANKTDEPAYRRRTVRGVGQNYSSFANDEKYEQKCRGEDEKNAGKQETIVTYNYVTIPKNFQKIYDKNCIRKFSPYYSDFPIDDIKSAQWWIEHELAHFSDSIDEPSPRESDADSDNVVAEPSTSTKCYNLEDHIVSKANRRKQRNRKTTSSSDFTIISGCNYD